MESENSDTDFIAWHSASDDELDETIQLLIRHREMLREHELEELEQQADELVRKLKDIELRKALVEIRYLKQIIALRKRLMHDDE